MHVSIAPMYGISTPYLVPRLLPLFASSIRFGISCRVSLIFPDKLSKMLRHPSSTTKLWRTSVPPPNFFVCCHTCVWLFLSLSIPIGGIRNLCAAMMFLVIIVWSKSIVWQGITKLTSSLFFFFFVDLGRNRYFILSDFLEGQRDFVLLSVLCRILSWCFVFLAHFQFTFIVHLCSSLSPLMLVLLALNCICLCLKFELLISWFIVSLDVPLIIPIVLVIHNGEAHLVVVLQIKQLLEFDHIRRITRCKSFLWWGRQVLYQK